MPYLLEANNGEYDADVSMAKGVVDKVETSRFFGLVSRDLKGALSMRELVRLRGVETRLTGIGKEPLDLPLDIDTDIWPVGLFELTTDNFDRVF